jgi:Protein of unknown function (DUF3343).
MKDENFGVFSFTSTHYAIAAERTLSKTEGTRLIPIPPEIYAGCGLALRTKADGIKTAAEVLAAEQIPYEGIYTLSIKNKKRTIGKIEDDLL